MGDGDGMQGNPGSSMIIDQLFDVVVVDFSIALVLSSGCLPQAQHRNVRPILLTPRHGAAGASA